MTFNQRTRNALATNRLCVLGNILGETIDGNGKTQENHCLNLGLDV